MLLPLEGPAERPLALLAAARPVAGNTGSTRRSSDIHRMLRTDPLGCHSIGRIVRCNLMLDFQLREPRRFLEVLGWLWRRGPETAGHRNRRIHLGCRSLDGRLAGSRCRSLVAGEGSLCIARTALSRWRVNLGRAPLHVGLRWGPGHWRCLDLLRSKGQKL